MNSARVDRWVWVPDEKSGYLPGWIVKEEKSDLTQPLKTNKAKGDAAGDYLPVSTSRHGREVTLEDASLVGDTIADVVLANGGDVSPSVSYTSLIKDVLLTCKVWHPLRLFRFGASRRIRCRR